MELSERPAQFDKNLCMEEVLQRFQKVREVSIGKNRRISETFIQYVQENQALIYAHIRHFCRNGNKEFKQLTYVSYTLDEFKEQIQNLLDFSKIEHCTFQ